MSLIIGGKVKMGQRKEQTKEAVAKSATPQLNVESIMTANVQRINPEMSVREVIKILTTHRISGAPIVDTLGKVISVVSEGDLLKLATSVGLDKPMSFCLRNLPKQEQLITLKKTSPFSEAYSMFLSHPVHRIIVIDGNGKLQGILSRSNILRVLSAPDETAQQAAPAKAAGAE
jgi:predicted transcriptional regulator